MSPVRSLSSRPRVRADYGASTGCVGCDQGLHQRDNPPILPTAGPHAARPRVWRSQWPSEHRRAKSRHGGDPMAANRRTVGPNSAGGWHVTGGSVGGRFWTQAEAERADRQDLLSSAGGELVVKGQTARSEARTRSVGVTLAGQRASPSGSNGGSGRRDRPPQNFAASW
jgi:hypothetical protein